MVICEECGHDCYRSAFSSNQLKPWGNKTCKDCTSERHGGGYGGGGYGGGSYGGGGGGSSDDSYDSSDSDDSSEYSDNDESDRTPTTPTSVMCVTPGQTWKVSMQPRLGSQR